MARKYLTPINLSQNEIQNAVIQNLGSDPGSPVEGQIWHRTDDHMTRIRYSGSTCIIYPGATVAAASTVVLRDSSGDFAAHDITANKVTGLASPSGSSDAATKGYVDAAIQGLDTKQSVRAATTTNGTLATAFANGQSIDGVTLVTGDRILLKNQSAATANGIYVVAASGAPARASDADTGAEIEAAFVFVEEGTTNADTGWVMTFNGIPVLGTDNITWAQFSGAGSVTAGAGMTQSGNTLNVIGNAGRIVVNADDVDLASGVCSPGTYDTVTVDTYGRVTSGTTAGRPKKYSATIGDGSSTAIAVTQGTHGCASDRSNVARVNDESTGAEVECDVTYASNGTVTFTFATAPTTNQYRVVIIG